MLKNKSTKQQNFPNTKHVFFLEQDCLDPLEGSGWTLPDTFPYVTGCSENEVERKLLVQCLAKGNILKVLTVTTIAKLILV